MLRGNGPGMVLGIALMFAGSVVQAQAPGPSAPERRAKENEPNTAAARPKVEFRVVFWYEAKHPARTLKWKIYDLRQGSYDRLAVDDWLARLKSEFPAYAALDRRIELEALPAATESDRLAVAFAREQQRVLTKAEASAEPEPVLRGGMSPRGATGRGTSSSSFAGSYSLSELMHPGGISTTTSGRPGHGSGSSFPGVPPGSGGYSRPPSSPSPFPYPYSRPHP